jgi:glycerol-3-phosphate acyltransferase PlsY
MTLIIMWLIAYALGSLVPGYWIGQLHHKNLLKEGSGNIGTTNTFRVLGAKAGSITLMLDLLKGTAAGCLPLLFQSDVHPFIVGAAAILGHTFSPWIGFKGGKAVATSAGVLLAYDPSFFGWVVVVMIISLLLTSMVSVGAIFGFLFASLYSLTYHDWILSSVAIALTIFVIYRHRTNIARIRQGTESLVPFGLNYWRQNKKAR